jgi:3-demethoxyubiquinol 3-hydroxylase
MRSEQLLDPLITAMDRALRSVSAPARAGRPVPPLTQPSAELSPADRRHAAGLMRVNHSGEIAAQALYHGQALAARTSATRDLLLRAAREESDHLAWCQVRLRELDSRPSLLDPFWYAGSFAIGALAGAIGDRTSLGFVAETERQVQNHLAGHLQQLPPTDTRSRAIVSAMSDDEQAHGSRAWSAGAAELPGIVKSIMRRMARVMTGTAYWI